MESLSREPRTPTHINPPRSNPKRRIDDLTGSAESEKAGRLIYILSSDAQPDQVISLRYLDIAVDGSGSAVECGEFARSMTFDVTSASARHAYDLELAGSTTRLFPHTGDLIVVDA